MRIPITANYTDPLLDSIKARVNTKKDNIPFLLLPVRLETRFMKVQKSIFSETVSPVEQFLELFGNINISLLEGERQLTSVQIRNKYVKIIAQIKALNLGLKNSPKMTAQEIHWLKQQHTITQKEGGHAARRIRVHRAQQLALVRGLVTLKKRMDGLGRTKDNTYWAASNFIERLHYFNRKWSAIGGKNMPYSNPRMKKRLYQYLSSSLTEVTAFYALGENAIEELRFVRKNQVDQIEKLLKEISSNIEGAPRRLASFFTDGNWEKFLTNVNLNIHTKILPEAQDFSRIILTRLRLLEKYKQSSAKEIYFKGIQTLVDLKRFNEHHFKGYKDVKKSRKKLDARVKSLATMTDQAVSAQPDQILRIQALWRSLNPLLEQYQTKVNTLPSSNNSQRFGIDLTVNFVNTTAKRAIAGLNSEPPKNFTYFNHQEIRESSNFYLASSQSVQELKIAAEGLANGNATSKEIEAFTAKVFQVGNQFKIASRKNVLLPEADKNTLENDLKTLKHIAGRVDSSTEKSISEMEAVVTNDFVELPSVSGLPEGFSTPPVLVNSTKTKNELWLRIFPDDIHVHTHEEGLTENEIRLGKDFWTYYWMASGEKDLETTAWRGLRLALGVRRAAWVAKKLQPREHRYKNKRPFFQNVPSKTIIGLVQQMKEVHGMLKGVTIDDSYAKIEQKIDLVQVHNAFKTILTKAKTIAREQQHFLQKTSTPLRRIEGIFNLIQEAIAKLDQQAMNAHTASLMHVQGIFETYTLIREHFSKIKALSAKDYAETTPIPLTFPRVATKREDWTTTPHAKTLPNRFVAITIQKGQYKHIAVGKPVPENLQLGLDPKKFDLEDVFQLDGEGNLQVDEGMLWMTDYQEAVRLGMGITLPLTTEEAAEGFDKVLVIGIKDISPTKARNELEKLLENHRFSPDGMSVLKKGTPTNNTEEGRAGYDSTDDNDEESFRVEMSQELFSNGAQGFEISDGQRLASALGVRSRFFQNVEHSDGSQISDAKAMNKALWHATVGHTMTDIWDSVFTYDNIDRSRKFFTENVLGRGNLPSLRIGTQPYGILTTTAFSQLRYTNVGNKDVPPTLNKANFENLAAIENQLQLRYDIRKKELLQFMDALWTVIRAGNVKHLGNVKDQNPQQHFMEMLGLNATTVEYFFRYGVNIAMRGPSGDDMDFNVNFKDEEYSPSALLGLFKKFMDEGYFYNSFNFGDEQSPNTDENIQKNLKASRIARQFEGARLFTSRFLDKHVRLNGEMIDGELLSEQNTLAPIPESETETYIDWLLKSSLYTILSSNQIHELPSRSLLFLLLRQSLMSVYNEAALKVMQKEDFFSESYAREIGNRLKYSVYHTKKGHMTYMSSWTFLMKDIDRLDGLDYIKLEGKPLFNHLNVGLADNKKSMADYLRLSASGNTSSLFNSFSGRAAHLPYIDRIKEVQQALKHLNTLSTASLDGLLKEHLDLCTYRLDAWMLGQSNERLEKQRSSQANGIHLGAFGWVEDLRPGGERAEAPDVPKDLTATGESVYTDADNEGFIHAPSLNQAIAAAVLRSGYSANSAAEDLSNTMAVNLSSSRVRMALNLLSGVQNGLEVGAVLGFQFERGLHERYAIAELNKFIQPFRKEFPLTIPVEEEANGAVRETTVVNGMTFLDRIQDFVDGIDFKADKTLYELFTDADFAQCPLWLKTFVNTHGGGDNELRVIIAEIDRMANAFDALGDLALSESVYQIVQGNHVRAAAMVNALAEGKNPPMPQIIHSPRVGTVVTQRVSMHLDPIASSANAQPADWSFEMTPRALAEPSLNNWLGGLMGNPQKIQCLVAYMDGDTSKKEMVTVADLKLQPIDFLYLLGSASHEGSNDLNKQIAYFVRKEQNLPLSVPLHLQFKERDVGWDNTIVSFYEIQPLLQQILELLNDAIPLTATELQLPPEQPKRENPGGVNAGELKDRISIALQEQQQLSDQISALITPLTTDTDIATLSFSPAALDQMPQLLLRASRFGIPNSIPDAVIELDDTVGRDQLRQLVVISKQLKKRLGEAKSLEAGLADDAPASRKVEIYRDMGKSVFGKQFTMLPQYHLENFEAIKTQLELHEQGKGLLRHDTDGLAMDEWLQSLGRVRQKMYATEMAAMLSDTLGQDFPEAVPIQFPFENHVDHTKNDYWSGAEYPTSYVPKEDKLSLVMLQAEHLVQGVAESPRLGFIIDEWIEIIPQRESTTGLTFHYDQPDATAPQSVLLAVTPQETGKWEWDDLVMSLVDTLNLAKNRAVEPDHLEKTLFAQTLPAIMAEVVPPQLREEIGSGDFRNPLGTQVVLDFADNLKEDE